MIGIFDSGLGGLTIYKEIKKLLPQYDYLYLGDTARTPYGNRSQETVYKFTEQAVDFLFSQGCNLVITACNTASAKALRRLQFKMLEKAKNGEGLQESKSDIQDQYKLNLLEDGQLDCRVLGVIRPLIEEAIKVTRYGRIGVIGTRGTIDSNVYEIELNNISKELNKKIEIQVFQQSCPLLVPLVEEGWFKQRETKMILRKYLRPLKNKKIDTLILGCTHYPFLIKEIQIIMGKNCRVLNSGEIVAKSLENYLQRHPEIEEKLSKNGKSRFLVTDDNSKFALIAKKWLNESIKLDKIELK